MHLELSLVLEEDYCDKDGLEKEIEDDLRDNEYECLGLVDLQYIVIDSTRVIAHDHLVHGHHGIWNVLEVISLETKA